MWVAGFIARLPALQLPGPLTASILGAILFLACLCSGYRRTTPVQAITCGITTALVAALINLMMLGSLLIDDTGAAHPNTALSILGFFAASTVLGAFAGAIGGHLGRNNPLPPDDTNGRAQFARFAIIAALSTLPVLLVGGLVTSNDAGLSVPDWPTSYGLNMILFPLSRMTGGIYYEHAHRLFGMLAGLGALLLFAYAIARLMRARDVDARERTTRKRDVALALVALIAVSVQGVLGGVRVTDATGSDDPANITENYDTARDAGTVNDPNFALTTDTGGSKALALVHGITGQLTFALLCVIAAMFCPAWIAARDRTRTSEPRAPDRLLQAFAYFLIGTVFLQLILGAMVRHTHQSHALFTHIGMSMLVVALAAFAGLRAVTRHRQVRNLRRFGNGALHSTLMQFALGWSALFIVVPNYKETGPDPTSAVLIATAHQFLGAVVIAMTALLAAWTWRESAPPSPSGRRAGGEGS